MRMERQEIRHSAILAWLLDPAETHGLSDRFLKAFISEALRGRKDLGWPTALDVSQSDLRDAEVRREWQNIDILLISPRNGWAFVVENKFDSRQHEGQLAKYAERVRAIYESAARPLTVRGLFLTLQGEEPEDASYAPITYEAIVELLPRLMAIEGQALGPEVAAFLRQYLEVLRDATGMSDELTKMAQLARELYRRHRKVLDFVIEHGQTTDFSLAVEALFGDDLSAGMTAKIGGARYEYAWHNQDSIGFIPSDWAAALGGDDYWWPGCSGWQGGYPVALWFRLVRGEDGSTGTLKLKAEVGPLTNHRCRSSLISAIIDCCRRATEGLRLWRAAAEGGAIPGFGSWGLTVNDISDASQITEAMTLLVRHEKDFINLLRPWPRSEIWRTA